MRRLLQLEKRVEAVAGRSMRAQQYIIERTCKETGELIYRREVEVWPPRAR